MALSAGNAAIWSDITAIYNRINTARGQHSMGNISVPNNQNATMTVAQMTALKSAMDTLHNESHLRSVSISSVTVPGAGTLISPGFINTISSNISRMTGVCHFGFSRCSWSQCSWGDCSWGQCSDCSFRDGGGFN